MRAAGNGLAEFHCKRCVARRARHGSYWAPTILATDLKPYFQSAAQWIKRHRAETFTKRALIALQGLLDTAGQVLPAQDIKRRSAPSRSRIAFARLREANIKPERFLAIHMAVSALIAIFTTRRHVAECHHAAKIDRAKNHDPGGDEIIRS